MSASQANFSMNCNYLIWVSSTMVKQFKFHENANFKSSKYTTIYCDCLLHLIPLPVFPCPTTTHSVWRFCVAENFHLCLFRRKFERFMRVVQFSKRMQMSAIFLAQLFMVGRICERTNNLKHQSYICRNYCRKTSRKCSHADFLKTKLHLE